jgi:hypothetical protein
MNDSRAASDLETARRRAFASRARFGDDGDGDGDDGGVRSPPATSPSPPARSRSFLPNSIQRQRQREGPPPGRTPLLLLLPPSLAVAAYVPALTTIATYFNTKSTAHVRHVASTNPGAAPSASCDASGRGETLVSQ